MITINFDLDGVLCDYDTYWGSDKTFNKARFHSEIMDNKMFEKLLPMMNGFELFWGIKEYLSDNKIEYNFQILSSLGSPNDMEVAKEATRQKELWVRRYLGEFVGNLNFVEHKGKKKWFATPTSILIDDTNENVQQFIENHGHGILFNNDMDFDSILKQVLFTIDLINYKIQRKVY